MALTPFTGTISLTTLRANFDDKTATLNSNASAGNRDFSVCVFRNALAAADDVSLRSFAWTAPDDAEVRSIGVQLYRASGTPTVTCTLTVDDGSTAYLIDRTISASATYVASSPTIGRTNYLLATDTSRIKLIKGVRYRLTIAHDGAGTLTRANGWLMLRTTRRRQ